MDKFTGQKIYREIQKAKNILVTTHVSSDGDAVGVTWAMAYFLKQLQKKNTVLLHEKIKDEFDFLPFFDEIINAPKKIIIDDYDLIIVLDCADFTRSNLGRYLNFDIDHPLIINIDHHPNNPEFGEINLVIKQASSTAEIVFDWFKQIDFKVDKAVSEMLLCGMVSDTESFSNAATNQNVLQQASELMQKGANLNLIVTKVLKNKKLRPLNFLGKVLTNIKFNTNFKLASALITNQDLEDFGLKEEELSGVANFLKNTEEGEIFLVLKETADGYIKGSLRSKKVNIEPLAQALGGGGHEKSSGFILKGKLTQLEDKSWRVE
ncbi:MAG TPA: bifunctional oligoribonuclease/PAP phosphatase NrnA [bacterium]|nr:bifunctional oligoribonuclease/PAP phosphatase NrnA [bacterium]